MRSPFLFKSFAHLVFPIYDRNRRLKADMRSGYFFAIIK